MREFQYNNAESFNKASKILQDEKSIPISGGTDLTTILKDEILEDAPDTVVNLKTIDRSAYIHEEKDCFKIGALTKLVDIAESQVLQKRMPILSQAAKSIATPLIRNSATVGGNICQDVRCEYYRYPHQSGGRISCYRKGGNECLALHGNNEYHSVFGGMKLHNTPCTENCPAGTDIPAYMERLRNDDIDGAARIILKVNPLAAITGRVCAHFCQEACNRNQYDETVAVGNAERFLGDYILENSSKYFAPPKKSSGKKIAIVGSGPAGLSAAYFLRREGHEVAIFERKEEAGGILRYAIPAYRLPKDVVRKAVTALTGMGIKFKTNTEIGKDILPENLEKDFDKVFYDIGAWGKSLIGFDGEELTVFGLEFLTEIQNWMDGNLGQNVVVVGGGNVAMDVATTAKRLGAKNVIVACLESAEEMPAMPEDIKRAEEQGVEIINSCGVYKINRDGNKIKGIELVKCTSVFDENECFAPEYDVNCSMQLEAESVLMATGQKVDLSFLDKKYQLELTSRGVVAVDENYRTNKKNVYAGGDMTSGPATVIKAIAAGHGAADAINDAFGVEKQDLCDHSMEPAFLKFDEAGVRVKEASELPLKLAEDRTIDTEDHYTGLPWEMVKAEASRCQNCGCLAVSPSDVAPVLVALDAIIKTTEREIRAFDFFKQSTVVDQVLRKGEIVKEIEIPACDEYNVAFNKLPIEDGTNFAVASVASAYKMEAGSIVDARIVLGGVAPVPYRVRDVEAYVKGKKIDESVAALAGELACRNAVLLKGNAYKLKIIAAQVKNSLLNASH